MLQLSLLLEEEMLGGGESLQVLWSLIFEDIWQQESYILELKLNLPLYFYLLFTHEDNRKEASAEDWVGEGGWQEGRWESCMDWYQASSRWLQAQFDNPTDQIGYGMVPFFSY